MSIAAFTNRKFTGSDPVLAMSIARRQFARLSESGDVMKKIGFLSFGHWSAAPHSATRSASDVLLQSIDLAVAAEEQPHSCSFA